MTVIMKLPRKLASVALTAIALAVPTATAAHADPSGLAITAPAQLVQCQQAQLAISGGTGPYDLRILDPKSSVVESLPTVQGSSSLWVVDLPAGTEISISVTDSTGAVASTPAMLVQPGSDSSCLSASH